MKKYLTILALLLFITNSPFAQMNDMAVGLNGTVSVPIGDFNDVAKMGLGISGSFFYELSDNFEATGTLGYISWGGDKLELVNTASSEAHGSYTTIPILIGGRYILNGDELLPYISGELGLHIFSTPDHKITINDIVVESADGESNVYFGFGLGGGAIYELSSDIKLDGSLQYNIISAEESLGFFSLELGFIVGIN